MEPSISNSTKLLHTSTSDFLLALLAFCAFGIALMMQHMFDLIPCPLCIVQRIVIVLIGAAYVLTWAAHRLNKHSCGLYWLPAFISFTGVAVAARHVWLQYLPKDELPGCIPSLGYIYDTFPLGQAIARTFQGSASCGEVMWTFLGLSIPEQTLVIFVSFMFVSILKALVMFNGHCGRR